jgi:riboflavin synthase
VSATPPRFFDSRLCCILALRFPAFPFPVSISTRDEEAALFTGIIEHLGTIAELSVQSGGGRVSIQAPTLAPFLAVSGSIAVNGCCLTIVSAHQGTFSADLSSETLRRTSLSRLRPGMRVNLERPLTAGKEFGGHFVLGHVDGTGKVHHLQPDGDNWWFGVEVPEDFARYIVPKGSITIDGISLTVARHQKRVIEAAIIPYTYEHTNLSDRRTGELVNLEGDVIGKYVERHLEARETAAPGITLKLDDLIREGF